MAPRAHGYIGAVTAKPRGRRAITSRADIVAFGRFRLDRKLRVLLCDGQRVPVGAKALDLLECLIDGRAAVMSKQSILACVWADRVVGDGNLPVQVHILRTALAPHGGDGLILGVQNGYRFVGEVAEPAEVVAHPAPLPEALQEPAPAPERAPPIRDWQRLLAARRRGLFVAGWMVALFSMVALVLATAGHDWSAPALPRLSIAVLPFRDRSDGAAHASLADAITDDLTTDLSHIPGSVVVARASVDAMRDGRADAVEIGRRLKVRYLLTGSIRAEDAVYRINADLAEAASGREIWSERFDTPLGALAETQTAIVRRIASALDATMTQHVAAQALHDRPNDPTAQDLFFRARAVLERDDTLAGFTGAQDLLERAVGLQPQYVDALAELGLALVLKTRIASDPTPATDLDRARAVIGQALQLSQTNPTALAADARLHETEGDCMQATQSANAALGLEPNGIDALAVLAKCSADAGKLDEAAGYETTLLGLNPDSGRGKPRYLLLSQIRLLQGRYRNAIDLAFQAIAGDPTPTAGADCMGRAEYARLLLIAGYELNGDAAKGRELYTAYNLVWPHRSVWRVAAYSPRGMAESKGFGRFMSGLAAAGMPPFADERIDDHVNAASVGRAADDFAPTPLISPPATTVGTDTLAATLATGRPMVVLDLGQGAAVIPRAAWFDRGASEAGNEETWMDAVLAGHPNTDRLQPIVVMATGTYGQAALRGVRHLVTAGYRHVYWYRGGEEAWAKAGFETDDRRLAD